MTECIHIILHLLDTHCLIQSGHGSKQKLAEIKNIAASLNDIGIFSEKDLQCVGAIQAGTLIKEYYPNETSLMCYYLSSLKDVLSDTHWNTIGKN